jgi:lysophospholipase L1-like esterase
MTLRTAQPISDEAVTGWSPSSGSTLFDKIAVEAGSISSTAPTNAYKCKLSALQPAPNGSIVASLRIRTSSFHDMLTVHVMDGTTMIAARELTVQHVGVDTTVTFTMTPAEVAAISDFSNLYVNISSFNAQESMAEQFTANGDMNPAAAASIPTITLGTTSPTLAGEAVQDEDGRIRKLGGNGISASGSIYPHTLFSTEYNLSFDASTRTTIGAVVEFTTSCPKFEILQVGSSVGWRLIVDGQHAGTFDGHAADGTLKYVLVDFSSIDPGAVSRHIRIEYSAKSVLVSLKMDTVGSLETVTYAGDLSICFLGDSFTEGTGASEVERHAGYAPYAAKRMGFKNYAMSGFGGTGYKRSFYPGYGLTRPNLATRCVWDAVGYDAYVVAMGINDTGDTDIDAEIATTFDSIRAANPVAPVYVLGAWGNGSGEYVTGGATVDSKISAACSGRSGFYFIPVYQVAFTKYDATHPDAAGHVTLGTYVSDQIKFLAGIV